MLGALENSQKSLAMSTSHIRAAYITIRSYGFYRGVIITVGKVSKMEGPENTVRTVQITEKEELTKKVSLPFLATSRSLSGLLYLPSRIFSINSPTLISVI